jgi:hypothetical protein
LSYLRGNTDKSALLQAGKAIIFTPAKRNKIMDIAFLENLAVATGMILLLYIADRLTKKRRKMPVD